MATTTDTTRKSTALLHLDTVTERPFITIDKRRVEVRNLLELSAGGYHTFQKAMPRIGVLWQKESLSDEESAEFSALLLRVCTLVCDASPEVLAPLTDLQRFQIVNVFQQLSLQTRRQAAGAFVGVTSATGAKLRRGSRGSTAGTR